MSPELSLPYGVAVSSGTSTLQYTHQAELTGMQMRCDSPVLSHNTTVTVRVRFYFGYPLALRVFMTGVLCTEPGTVNLLILTC